MAQSFAATVGKWAEKVPEAVTAVFRASAQQLAHELTNTAPVGPTGFLQASLVASNSAMPTLSRKNPGVPAHLDLGEVLLVINGTDLGEPLYLGYTAEYGAYVHFGTSKMAGRPWVTLVAQRWRVIVAENAARVKRQFDL